MMTIEEILTNTITKNIHSITSELRVMESLIHEEKELGAVRCHWNTSQESSSRKCFLSSVQDERFGWIAADSKDEYGRILEAKFACERRGTDCAGVSLYLDGAFFQLLTERNDYDSGQTDAAIKQAWFNFINSPGMNTGEGNMTTEIWHNMETINATADIWLKDCPENHSLDAVGTNFLHYSSRISKSDFASGAMNTSPKQALFNFTINRATKSEQGNITGAFHTFEVKNTASDAVNQSSDAKTARGANFLQDSSRISGHVVRKDAGADASVTVYEYTNYAGSSTVFTGAVDVKQPWNTTISSLRFPWKGWSVVAFDPDGRQVAYNGDTSYVGDEMNDRISSLVVLPFQINELCYTVYEHKDYGGQHQRFCGNQDLSSSSWNNIISSLQVETEGCGLILYDSSYHVKFKMFSSNESYVGRDWNDKATSIQIRPWIMDNNEGQIQPVHAYLRVYEHKNYAGSSTVFTKTVDIKQPWNTTISSLCFPWKGWSAVAFDPDGRQVAYNGDTSYVGDEMNDRISSLVVLPFQINELCYTVYEHKDYGGQHQRFCGDQDLSSSSWNNIISSLQVETEDCGLILYDSSYHGKFKMFSGNESYVGRDWNDKATSHPDPTLDNG